MYILDYIYYGCMLLLIGIYIRTLFLCNDLIDIENIIVSMLMVLTSSTIGYFLLRSML